MAATLTSNEQAQLLQTIEMFEVIAQSQPQDYQSLEILKEAYYKLGRQKDVISTSRRIAQAYVQFGQLSSAILEYEGILQRYPDDPEVKSALAELENRATNIAPPVEEAPLDLAPPSAVSAAPSAPAPQRMQVHEVDDGRAVMEKLFVEAKAVGAAEFKACWPVPDLFSPPELPVEPFIHLLAERGLMPVNRSLKLLSDRAKLCYQPLDRYDVDVDLARSFPRDTCRRWCVLPFDKMGKSVFVATANPFNKQAAAELEKATRARLVWYLSPPADLLQALRRVFR